jgi:hypothetical protein
MDLVILSIFLFGLSFILIILGVIFIFLKKTRDDDVSDVLKNLNKINISSNLKSNSSSNLSYIQNSNSNSNSIPLSGDPNSLNVKSDIKNYSVKNSNESLKILLISKFKPVIEDQLKLSVDIVDVVSKGDGFILEIEIENKNLLLTVDSSGKILDYKRKNAQK